MLIGDDGENLLFGGRGDDLVRGGDGDDLLAGGPGRGRDRLFGGPGDDGLVGSRGTSQSHGLRADGDRLGCGLGRDVVDDPGLTDRLSRGCESGFWPFSSAVFPFSMRLQPVAVTRRSVTLRSPVSRLRGSITLTEPGARRVVFGRWKGRFPRGRSPVRVPLTRAGRRAIADGRDVQTVFRARRAGSWPARRGYILPMSDRLPRSVAARSPQRERTGPVGAR